MALVGITHGDNEVDVENLCPKLINLKLWDDGSKSWTKSAKDMDYQILLVSQFTLYHQLKGTKPDFHDAMPGEQALSLYQFMLERLKQLYGKEDRIFQGAFGQHMTIDMANDGPVTLVIESKKDLKL